MKPPIRIAVLHLSHGTVTFLPNDTELADFLYLGSPAAGGRHGSISDSGTAMW